MRTTRAHNDYRETTWLNPKVEVRDSTIEGRGLFALQDIEPGEMIIIMGGRVLTDDEFPALRLEKYSSAAIDEGLNILLDTPNPAECGNHSCDANTWMRDEVTTEAMRLIPAGGELTIDYATHTGTPDWSMPCNCGSTLCRHTVTGNDWRRADVQERYRGHFSPFLNARIEQLRGRAATPPMTDTSNIQHPTSSPPPISNLRPPTPCPWPASASSTSRWSGPAPPARACSPTWAPR